MEFKLEMLIDSGQSLGEKIGKSDKGYVSYIESRLWNIKDTSISNHRRNRNMKRVCLIIAVLIAGLTSFSQSEYPVTYSIPKSIASKPGGRFVLPVVFKATAPWYIYAPTGNNAAQGMIETSIVFQLPNGITRNGKLQLPKTKFKGGYEVYEGKDIVFQQQFVTGKDMVPGNYIVRAKITYQTCNDKICLPPVTEEAVIKVSVQGQEGGRDSIIKETCQRARICSPGKQATAAVTNNDLHLQFTSLAGREINLASLRGKVVLIDCWATWCRPCIAEFPHLKKLYEQYKDQGFEVIGINMDEVGSKQRLRDLVKKYGLPWPQWFEGKGFDNNPFVKEHGIKELPAVFLVDGEGKIVERDARGERLEGLIKTYLGNE